MAVDSREVLMETHREMYFSTGEAARVLELSTSTVKRLESTGHLPSLKNHNGWRFFNAGDVYDFLDELGADT
ncbi:helix-turn-helix domain-containing protein [Nocardiopsis exhalans]|uniref:Helix-turn-helix domain-containing protein n=1 Tax=Nocardiopsis exhalans TaxID=163604 RepID=A0ABY5DD59_9ACTN|nr:helix-turn-helix domain-containing protein [Nocardiopsis exhalans]USY22262.1 helix-turn-helix domain-containing protein [Nocardiopsis exhalans]